MPGIGQLNEKPLHASLKKWYARPGDDLEVDLDGFVIDIVRDGMLLEIQTGSFAAIKSKLIKLTSSHHVRLIYPIALEKWIVKLPKEEGKGATRRKSPRKGRTEDLFWELVSFPQLLASPNFSVEVLMTREEEVRKFDGKRGWRRKGWVTEERRLLEVVEQRRYAGPADLRKFLPDDMETFTAKDLAKEIDVRENLAQKMVYCMRKATTIKLVGKQGRAYLYRVA